MNRSDYKRFSIGKFFDLLKLKEPDALYGPTLIRTGGLKPTKVPQSVDISRPRGRSTK